MIHLSRTTRGIIACLGALIIHFNVGNVCIFSNTNLYIATYLKYNSDRNIVKSSCYFLLPISAFFASLTTSLGGVIERKYGSRFAVACGIIMISSSFLIMSFISNLYLYYLLSAFIGSGSGIAIMPPFKTLWKFFPNHKGLFTGIVLSSYSLSAFFFNNLSNLIINPDNRPFDKDTHFYPKEIGLNVPNFFITSSICIFSSGLIGDILLLSPEQNKIEFKYSSEESLTSTEIPLKINKEPLKQSLKTKQFWIICCMSFFYLLFPSMMVNLIRPYGILNLSEENISSISVIIPIFSLFLKIFWGSMLDYIGFKKVYLILLLLGLICSSTLPFISDNVILYGFYCLITTSCYNANNTALTFVVSKIFGIKNSAEIYGLIAIFFGISGFIGPLIIMIIIRGSDDKNLYHIVFWIGSGTQIISIIICLLFEEKNFKYSEENSDYTDITIDKIMKDDHFQ